MASIKIVFNDEYGTTTELDCTFDPTDPSDPINVAFAPISDGNGGYEQLYLEGRYIKSALLKELDGLTFTQKVLVTNEDAAFSSKIDEYIKQIPKIPGISIPAHDEKYMLPNLEKRIQIGSDVIYKCTGPGFFYRQHVDIEKYWSNRSGFKIVVSDKADMSDSVVFVDSYMTLAKTTKFGQDCQMFPIMPGKNTYFCAKFSDYEGDEAFWRLYFVPAVGSTGGLSNIGVWADDCTTYSDFEKDSRLREILEDPDTTGGGSTSSGGGSSGADDPTQGDPIYEAYYWKIDLGQDFDVATNTTPASGTITAPPGVTLVEEIHLAADSKKAKTDPAYQYNQNYMIFSGSIPAATFTAAGSYYEHSYSSLTTDGTTKKRKKIYQYYVESYNDVVLPENTLKYPEGNLPIQGGTKDNPTVIKITFCGGLVES